MSSEFELSEPPSDVISSVRFAPGSSRLLVSSWDKHVYLYDVSAHALIRKIEHRAPVLDACFGKSDKEAFSVGLDWDVRRLDLETGEQTVLSSHSKGVKSVVYSPAHKILVSASWDSTLHIHFPADPARVPATVPLPSKPFSMSLTATKLVVAMASRQAHIYDLQTLAMLASQSNEAPPNTLTIEPWQNRESSLKFMTRMVACMPDDAGYATSSIEGRVAVDFFDAAEDEKRKYAFKCHRETIDDQDVVYPVNALAFHPVYGTFASGGGDGVVVLWDGIKKRRIRQYSGYPASVAAMAFSDDGKYFVVGVSPGFEDGQEDVRPGENVKVFIRQLADGEAKPKK